MELRVWVDGTQRVVCGVKLSTTCQEIVFALAHAIQQAGRFTMIEKWRNNERLLSPNERPLVTLQRWGDHMSEVEFILRKTSTDISTNDQPLQQSRPSKPTQVGLSRDTDSLQNVMNDSHIDSPIGHPTRTTQTIADQHHQPYENPYQAHHMYNINRRPQTSLGPLTSSNSSVGLPTSYQTSSQSPLSGLKHNFRPSASTTNLPGVQDRLPQLPTASSSSALLRPSYSDDQSLSNNSSPMMRQNHNGYTMHGEGFVKQPQQQQHQQPTTNQPHNDIHTQASKNYPYEDLYSTVNKKQNNPPPAVPAKPRVINNYGPNMTSAPPHQQQVVNQMSNISATYYQQQDNNRNSVNLYSNNLRPRQPPNYMEYIEAMANRNSLPQPMIMNSLYNHQRNLQNPSNMYQRSFDHQQAAIQTNGSSPASMYPSTNNRYRYSLNGQVNPADYETYKSDPMASSQNESIQTNTRIHESGLDYSRGSSVNLNFPSNSQSVGQPLRSSVERQPIGISQLKTEEIGPNVSQIGQDMLKVIEEQKKVLINQKNELDRLDNDNEYWEKKQNTEQVELINRIESEIHQLEELWRENQAQIRKLENQDFNKELQDLKNDQIKMEHEIKKQREKLSRCEDDIILCKEKIKNLESEISNLESETIEADDISDEKIMALNQMEPTESSNSDEPSKKLPDTNMKDNELESTDDNLQVNGTISSEGDQSKKEERISDEGDDDETSEEDSAGDASDDLNTSIQENRLRSNVKDIAQVDKRVLISGIRSLKLDKSRFLNDDSKNTQDSKSLYDDSIELNGDPDRTLTASENRAKDVNGQHTTKTANTNSNNNRYGFLMTL